MPYKEKEIVKKYYSIGEVAVQLNVSTSLIRFWESEFDIIKPKKNRKGNRQFTVDDIENIKLIYHLVREKGYTLQGAKELIRKNPADIKNKVQMADTLNELKAFLIEIRNHLPD